jgi:hypothetical protein
MVAFNNYHNNSSARLAKLQALMGGRQKRYASTFPIEDEDFAEAVLFTRPERLYDGVIPASHADPTIYTLAVVYSGSDPVRKLTALETGEGAGPLRELTATYHVSERDVVIEKGRGFLAWLIAKATFNTRKTSRAQSCTVDRGSLNVEDGTPQSSQRIDLCAGESKVLI